jgi:Cell wall-associated hydrolases (invasion-associated proteins)
MKTNNSSTYNSIIFKYTFLISIFICMSACSGSTSEKLYISGEDYTYSDSTKINSENIEANTVKNNKVVKRIKNTENDVVKYNSDQQVKTILYSIYEEWKDTRYKRGGMNKKGIDCSGLVYEIFRTSFAQILPRSTFTQIKVGKPVSKNSLKPGDLVFFKTSRNGRLHVGIYIEDKIFLHVSEKKGVILSNLDDTYWGKTYFKAKRVSDDLNPIELYTKKLNHRFS